MTRALTQREREVLAWISAGKSNAEIAIIMGISPWTVKIHVANMYKKLNVCSRGQAVAKAITMRLIEIRL
jgi:DNA-binding CsgD family transcriptional regulator